MTPTSYNNNNPHIPLLHESTYSPMMMMMMGSSATEFNDQPISTPPKLSLYSLSSKQSTLPEGLTPPPNTVATIPFLWEEAPGKPRTTVSAMNDDPPKSRTVRSLDLPPRLASPFNNGSSHCDKLVNNVGIAIIPSPTTVLSGPYEGIYASKSLLRSPEKVVVSSKSNKSKGKTKMSLSKLMRKERSPVKFSSWRWESFRDIDGSKLDRTPSLRFCSWRWDSFRDLSGRGGASNDKGGSLGSSFDDLQKSLDAGGNVRKVTRKHSFAFSKSTTSGILTSMYGSLKQAMPWRSRR